MIPYASIRLVSIHEAPHISYTQVVIANIKAELFENRSVTLENRVEFSSSPKLGMLHTFLTIICEELGQYDTWPVGPFGDAALIALISLFRA